MNPKQVTIIINSWDSKCGNCGGGADYGEKSHNILRGYGVKGSQKGCGAMWKYVSTEYGGEQAKIAAQNCRPDLEWFDLFPGGYDG